MRNFEAKQEDINAAINELVNTEDAEVIHRLAVNNKDIEVQKDVILNENTAARTLNMLAHKEPQFENKLLWIAQHPNTSAETLEWIYKRTQGAGLVNAFRKFFATTDLQADESIKVALAAHANTPYKVIKPLTRESSANVRLSLTDNPSIGATVKETLLTELIQSSDLTVKLSAVNKDETPEALRTEALQELCKEENKEYWHAVASGTHLDIDTVKTLLAQGNAETKKELFLNESLPAKAYAMLAWTADFQLLELLGDNPAVPTDVLAEMAETSIEALKEMERLKQYTLVAIAVASNPATPKASLEAFASMYPQAKVNGGLPGAVEEPEEEPLDNSIPAQLRYLALNNPGYKGN